MICAVYKTKYKNRITHNTKNLLFIRWAGVAVGGEESTAGASDLRAKTKKTKTKILACEQVLSDMAVAGLKPDAVSFNTMLQVR